MRISDVCPAAPEGELWDAAARFGINTKLREAHWLGQMAHESKGFEVMRESLNYSAAGLLATFSRSRISEADCYAYGRTKDHPANQPVLANILYGGPFGRQNLGNTEPGDGFKFRGRGFKQLTGRANYLACSLAVYGDQRLIEEPELLEEPEAASLSAAWFWKANNLNPMADRDDIAGITRKINGGTLGLAERKAWVEKFKAAL
jgi:putative chitinase